MGNFSELQARRPHRPGGLTEKQLWVEELRRAEGHQGGNKWAGHPEGRLPLGSIKTLRAAWAEVALGWNQWSVSLAGTSASCNRRRRRRKRQKRRGSRDQFRVLSRNHGFHVWTWTWLMRRHRSALERAEFCVQGTCCPAIHHQATRGVTTVTHRLSLALNIVSCFHTKVSRAILVISKPPMRIH